MYDGYIRVAAVTPKIRVADCEYNAGQIIEAIKKAADENVRLVCMPELCVTGYTCGDLFLQSTLLEIAKSALQKIVAETAECDVIAVVGLPMAHCGKLFNVAAVFCGGKVLGFVPKTFIPNYGEFYELRYFTPAFKENHAIRFDDKNITFGRDIIFKCKDLPEFKLAVEICEDLWVANPPSTSHGLANATIIANLSAGSELAGKAAERRVLIGAQSSRLLCGYVYAHAGQGESTTDMVFAAHNLIYERGKILAESPPFGDGWAVSEIDLNAIAYDRRRMNTFVSNAGEAENGEHYKYKLFSLNGKTHAENLTRHITPTPFIPENADEIPARCEEILNIQAAGLAKRLEHIGAKAVLGVSGGLDSTLALLVSARAYEKIGLPKNEIIAVTMPCFGTTERTKSNAHKLCDALEIPIREIDITESVRLHLRDIGHPENQHDITYENAQARIRTLVLMNLANQTNAIVIGTGNLSELALGWATFNGDHMSMYGVNGGIPKTLVRHIVNHFAQTTQNSALKSVLSDILATPVSPELLPPTGGEISQQTEEILGSYQLHDFFLYHTIRHARTPSQVLALAQLAFSKTHPPDEIKKRLQQFYSRFTSQQFKRNCLPDSPKIGSISLSPRGDWRMPSDSANFFQNQD
ncbi:MAG: NAD(+) synthase [Defluviitaleaceae bacterium]|nr:NAD(+) synthase [Defluviitaleaceae bacterium]MCL2262163.1 NAD(+) synthase [Defluviitaleaceae bacterium]